MFHFTMLSWLTAMMSRVGKAKATVMLIETATATVVAITIATVPVPAIPVAVTITSCGQWVQLVLEFHLISVLYEKQLCDLKLLFIFCQSYVSFRIVLIFIWWTLKSNLVTSWSRAWFSWGSLFWKIDLCSLDTKHSNQWPISVWIT